MSVWHASVFSVIGYYKTLVVFMLPVLRYVATGLARFVHYQIVAAIFSTMQTITCVQFGTYGRRIVVDYGGICGVNCFMHS